MERNIIAFRNTMSVSAFRAKHGTTEKVRPVGKKNADGTDATFADGEYAGKRKVFFALVAPAGTIMMSVSNKYYNNTLTKPVVSEIETSEGYTGYLLHQEGELNFLDGGFE